jgi:hypothetical protein
VDSVSLLCGTSISSSEPPLPDVLPSPTSSFLSQPISSERAELPISPSQSQASLLNIPYPNCSFVEVSSSVRQLDSSCQDRKSVIKVRHRCTFLSRRRESINVLGIQSRIERLTFPRNPQNPSSWTSSPSSQWHSPTAAQPSFTSSPRAVYAPLLHTLVQSLNHHTDILPRSLLELERFYPIRNRLRSQARRSNCRLTPR